MVATAIRHHRAVLRAAIALAVVCAVFGTGPADAHPVRSTIVNEQFYLAMKVKGCPCKGRLTGTFFATVA